MPETTPLIKAALNLRAGAGFDVYFLSCSLYSTIGLKGNTVNGMTFKPIQIWYYSSLVASWEQISRLRENLLPGNYEGSAIS